MFTGIITDIGTIVEVTEAGDLHARIGTSYDMSGVDLGASIACDGVCLTVVDRGASEDGTGGWFDVTISAETLSKTAIGGPKGWTGGRRVNLERALRLGDELGGHIVSGHVDGIATVTGVQDEGESTRFTFEAPAALAKFIAPKGSVALNGTSLTVNEVDGTRFGVNIIPHTKACTTWGDVEAGDPVHLEIDTLARYVARLNEMSAPA
ncbi:riboflavin synthase [Oceanomicrobium pacificus]|uniref:Riboflavin synthase n=1 Tax=Oceanomicrobium pacificus TaxID=2692916 RepID=A0A6B0TL60_9RHOB|nr:riboflavin synthase [Oceanomicrobium pacificus]MXU65237.1 riboflavin synthase [Oceanomicrobium pacificus]